LPTFGGIAGQLLLAFLGLAGGLSVASGVFTVFTAVGLVPRFAEHTGSGNHIMKYENAIILGCFAGNVFSLFFGLFGGLSLFQPGGGAVLREENRRMMKESGAIVWLTAEPETILERVKHSTDRPVLNGHMNVEYITGLMEKRRGCYEAAADFVVSTDVKSRDEICAEILELVK